MTQAILRARNTGGNALDQQARRRPAHRRPFLASLAVIAALAPAVSTATFIPVDAVFAANGRSIWSEGAGISENFNRFLGGEWSNNDLHAGKVVKKCVPNPFGDDFCLEFGAEIGARAHVRAGIPYGLKVESGTFDVHYPLRALFDVPTSVLAGPTNPMVTIGTSFSGLGGSGGLSLPDSNGAPVVLRSATLQVRGPDVQAYVEIAAMASGFAGARACGGFCYEADPTFELSFDKSKEIAAINRNGDGQIRVLETNYTPRTSFSAFGGLLNASFNLPDLDSSSTHTPGGFDGRTLVSSRRDSIAVVNANLAQSVLTAVGLGLPLSGTFGPFGYNLVQVNAGAYIDVQQTLTFTPTMPMVQLDFSSDVRPNIGGVDQAPTRTMNFRLGESVSFTPEALGLIGIVPTITLGGHITNSLDLVLGGHMDVKALGFDIFGLHVGPLLSEHLAANQLGTINLLRREFDLGLGSVRASPFDLIFGECIANIHAGGGDVYEPGPCPISGFAPDGLLTFTNGGHVDQLVRLGCNAFDCDLTPAGQTSLYFGSGSSKVFVGSEDAFSFDRLAPGASTSDASQAHVLAELAKATAEPTFIIPAGDPFPTFVPEPTTGALLGLALVGLLAVRASRSRRSRREGLGITA